MYIRILALNVVFTGALSALAWTVQLSIYPALQQLSGPTFSSAHALIATRLAVIAGPVMLAEILAAVLLVRHTPIGPLTIIATTTLALALLAWLTTILWSLPLHNTLAERYDVRTMGRLHDITWLQTTAWSLRWSALLAAGVMHRRTSSGSLRPHL